MSLRVVLALCVAMITQIACAQSDQRVGEAYLGLSLRDGEAGAVVSWIRPGPLGGRGFTSSSGVQRGDNLVAFNGQPVTLDAFREALAASPPGTAVTITFRRSPHAVMGGAVAAGGAGGEEYVVEAVVASRDAWSGTVGLGSAGRSFSVPEPGAFESQIRNHADATGALSHPAGLEALAASIAKVQADALDPLSLQAVVQALQHPLRLDSIESTLASRVEALRALTPVAQDADALIIAGVIRGTLGMQQDPGVLGDVKQSSVDVPADVPGLARRLVEQMRNDWSIQTDDAAEHLRVIRFAGDHARAMVDETLGRFVAESREWEVLCLGPAQSLVPLPDDELPEGFREAVAGDVYRVRTESDGRWSVHGGVGDNRYDTSRLAMVFDAGGNDTYTASRPTRELADTVRRDAVIIDIAGDDVYTSDVAFSGPGAAAFGYSLVDDRGGNDTYQTSAASTIGAGLFGVGIILDRGGDDIYSNTGSNAGFAIGAGFYGAGLVIDLAGHDSYLGEKLCEGVGAAGGFGAVVDMAGNDLYRANGPSFPSAYGTPGVFLGMSQGFGFGIRGYASGGVGALYDFGGNDRYEAGEFSQGGGYYFGLGVLHDRSGRDAYFGNRYGQAFAAHQAAGILVDRAGDDVYWSMTAASQSGAWDQSVTLLLDHAGDDTYRCDALGLGGAAMQSIALAIDLAGDDTYHAVGSDTLGRSGGNSYHFDSDGVLSFSFFLDAQGNDRYPPGSDRGDAVTHSESVPESSLLSRDSRLFGIFVDEMSPADE